MVLKIWQTAHPPTVLCSAPSRGHRSDRVAGCHWFIAKLSLLLGCSHLCTSRANSSRAQCKTLQESREGFRPPASQDRLELSENVTRPRCGSVSSQRARWRATPPVSSLPCSQAEGGDFTGGLVGPNGFPSENPPREKASRGASPRAPESVLARCPRLPEWGRVG